MARLFDMLIFDRPVLCPKCGSTIDIGYVKGFAGLLHEYRIGDCVALPAVTQVYRNPQHCVACNADTGEYYFLVVYRGILIGVTQDLRSAESLLQTLTAERLVALYHDLYRRSEFNRRTERQRDRPPASAGANPGASGAGDSRRAAVRGELDKLLEQILAEAEAEEPAPMP